MESAREQQGEQPGKGHCHPQRPQRAEPLLPDRGRHPEREDGDQRHHQCGVDRCGPSQPQQEEPLIHRDAEHGAGKEPRQIFPGRKGGPPVAREHDRPQHGRSTDDPPGPVAERRESARPEHDGAEDRQQSERHLRSGQGGVAGEDLVSRRGVAHAARNLLGGPVPDALDSRIMVMIRCPSCGQHVLDVASSCPKCRRVLIQNPLETHDWGALRACGRCGKHIAREVVLAFMQAPCSRGPSRAADLERGGSRGLAAAGGRVRRA
jgi:hypothetical protein